MHQAERMAKWSRRESNPRPLECHECRGRARPSATVRNADSATSESPSFYNGRATAEQWIVQTRRVQQALTDDFSRSREAQPHAGGCAHARATIPPGIHVLVDRPRSAMV